MYVCYVRVDHRCCEEGWSEDQGYHPQASDVPRWWKGCEVSGTALQGGGRKGRG